MATRRKKHPAAADAAAFDEQIAQEQAPAAPASDAPAMPSVETAPVAQAPAAPAAPVPDVHEVLGVPAPAAPVEPSVDWRYRAQQAEQMARSMQQSFEERMAQERQQAAMQAQQYQEQLQAAQQERDSFRTNLERVQRERLMEVDYSTLEGVDPDLARELVEKTVRPMLERTREADRQEFEARLARERQAIEQLEAAARAREQSRLAQRMERMNQRVREAHPDVDSLATSSEFQSFLDSRVPGTRTTYRAELGAAYNDGDADFVLDILGRFRGATPAAPTAPSLEALAGAPAGGGETTVATRPAEPVVRYQYSDLEDWRASARRGEITRDELRKRIAAFNEAEAAGQVQ